MKMVQCPYCSKMNAGDFSIKCECGATADFYFWYKNGQFIPRNDLDANFLDYLKVMGDQKSKEKERDLILR